MPAIQWLEICGFRAFTEKQRLDFTGPLALIAGPNSHGKTSIAEAVEFLLCGETLRRALLGGAKAEFEGILRNAHLTGDAPVWVKAGMVGADGTAHDVLRTLTRDYPADSVCESELSIDGQPATDLSSLGIVLSDPPLKTPILFQHTVRFALSAAPKERAEYFRAIIEVADLETVREKVIALREQLRPPADMTLQRLGRVASLATLGPVCDAIRGATNGPALQTALEQGISLAAEEFGIESHDSGRPLSEQAQWLLAATKAHGERAFQSAAFQSAAPPRFELPVLTKAGDYVEATADADHEIERLRRLFEATLELPNLSDVEHPVDCPVCETPEALTPARLQAMRDELASATQFRAAQSSALQEVDAISSELARVEKALPQSRPAAADFGSDEYQSRQHQAEGLVEDGATRLSTLKASLQNLNSANERTSNAVRDARKRLASLRAEVAAGKRADLQPTGDALKSLSTKVSQLAEAHSTYEQLATPILGEIRAAAVERQQVGPWADLAELALDPTTFAAALKRQRAHQSLSKELERAITDIERGIGRVVDAKFEAISNEIAEWWRLLRPEEPVEFNRIGRKGTGRRYVLFKALLRPSVGATGVERDALGVFSDSQLNALGLAAFLARSAKQQTPFLILDDPVQAGDEDHRATFNAGVLQELIDRGIHVIVVSQDEMLSKLMHSRYEHLPVNGFSITMETPGDGARVVATSDTAEALLQRAGATLRNDNPEIRKQNSAKVREAAERLAKEILVRKRTAAGETATIADYDGKTLGPLIADLEPYLDDPSHKGKWRNVNELVSRGGLHDTEVPTTNDLSVAHGNLKQFRRHYAGASSPP